MHLRPALSLALSGLSVALLLAAPASAQTAKATAKLMTGKGFAAAEAKLSADYDRIVADIITFTEIPAPPFGEAARARAFAEQLSKHGLSDVEIDAEGNAMGLRKGTGGGGLLVVAAHLDTVFPEGTDVRVRKDGNRLYAPGISDDSASLSVLLGFIRALDAAGIKTKGDILFVGNVGEEGPGDLRGVKYLFNKGKYAGKITHFFSVEPGADGRMVNGGTGSKRYEVTFRGPGGHSFGHFGMVSPAYAVGDAIMRLSQYDAPKTPKTTYSVGLISGGTSVNTIPASMSLTVDMRSNDAGELGKLDAYFKAQVDAAAEAENTRHSTTRGRISAEMKLIGERPTGHTPENSPLAQITRTAYETAGQTVAFSSSSTDSNLPMSLNIPALTIGSGFASEGAHSPTENLTLDRERNLKVMGAGLAAIISAANIAK
ncbi:MAG: M20/M25/M40 family metallo-hydrolase [Asticcacaulis sp.]